MLGFAELSLEWLRSLKSLCPSPGSWWEGEPRRLRFHYRYFKWDTKIAYLLAGTNIISIVLVVSKKIFSNIIPFKKSIRNLSWLIWVAQKSHLTFENSFSGSPYSFSLDLLKARRNLSYNSTADVWIWFGKPRALSYNSSKSPREGIGLPTTGNSSTSLR